MDVRTKEYYSISIGSYLDATTKNYLNVLILDREPSGELLKLVTIIPSTLSLRNNNYNTESNCHCRFAFTKFRDISPTCYERTSSAFMTEHDLPALFTKLNDIHYRIDTDLTQIMKNVICNNNSKLVCYITK